MVSLFKRGKEILIFMAIIMDPESVWAHCPPFKHHIGIESVFCEHIVDARRRKRQRENLLRGE
ncbi:hypothetical protein N7540_013262 [Penicillium herquei]|nr:hypothetical protein N7540_013262 [Penicillium herquei]